MYNFVPEYIQLGHGERWYPTIVLWHPSPESGVRKVSQNNYKFAIESGMHQTRQKQPPCNFIINSISAGCILIVRLMHPANHNLILPSERLRPVRYRLTYTGCIYCKCALSNNVKSNFPELKYSEIDTL